MSSQSLSQALMYGSFHCVKSASRSWSSVEPIAVLSPFADLPPAGRAAAAMAADGVAAAPRPPPRREPRPERAAGGLLTAAASRSSAACAQMKTKL